MNTTEYNQLIQQLNDTQTNETETLKIIAKALLHIIKHGITTYTSQV